MKKVSVIVPVYNVEKYIDKCLNTLVNQTLKDIEIIIVNDGSPDNSQEIIDKYQKKYPKKIKSYIKENGGQGSARNFGLEKATGEYIGYVDSDDFIELDMYEKLYNKAKKNDLDIVICGNYCVTETGNKTEESDRRLFSDKKKNAFFGKMAVWNKIYKRELLLNSNISFRSKLWYEDLDFTVQILSLAKKVGYVDKPLYNYLIREGSTMNNSNIKRNLEILLAFDEVLKNDKIKDNKEIIEFLGIFHILIAATVRVVNADADKKNKKEIINKLLNYVEEHFPSYKSNKYLNTLEKNKKIIYKLILIKQYWLIKVIFKIKRR